MRKQTIILILLALLLPMVTPATTYYYAPAAAGSNNGTSCANAYAWTDATNGISVASKQATGGNGNVLHMCPGTYTCSGVGATGITFNASGSSSFPVTLQGDSGGVVMTCPYWGQEFIGNSGAAITCPSTLSYILIDGIAAADFVVKNTNNGAASLGYGYQQASTLINMGGGCSHTEVRNITAGPVYFSVQDDTGGSAPNDTVAIVVGEADFQSIHDSKFNNAEYPVAGGYSGASQISSFLFYNNTVDYGCHLVNFADASGGDSATGVVFHNNTIGPHQQLWGSTACHQDGMLIAATNSPSTLSLTIYDNVITSDQCSIADSANNCTALIFFPGAISNTTLFNNVLAYSVPGQQGGEAVVRPGAAYTAPGGSEANIHWYNNTFIGTQGSGCTQCSGINMTSGSGATQSGFISENNIFYGFQGGTEEYLAQNDTLDDIFGSNIDYNLSYSVNQVGFEYPGGIAYHWSTPVVWTTSHATNSFPGYDVHGAYGDPMLSSSYVPQTGSAAIGLGANLTSLCTGALTALCSDAAGNPRPASGAWTVGAYQVGGTPTVVTPVISPASESTSVSVTVAITTMTGGATICYTTDGTAPTTDGSGTCTHGTTYTGSFASGVPAPTITINAIATESGYSDSALATPAIYSLPGTGSAPCPQCFAEMSPTDLTAQVQ